MFPGAGLVQRSASVRVVRHSVALFADPHEDTRGLVHANGAWVHVEEVVQLSAHVAVRHFVQFVFGTYVTSTGGAVEAGKAVHHVAALVVHFLALGTN
jgi:hypothetical protein